MPITIPDDSYRFQSNFIIKISANDFLWMCEIECKLYVLGLHLYTVVPTASGTLGMSLEPLLDVLKVSSMSTDLTPHEHSSN